MHKGKIYEFFIVFKTKTRLIYMFITFIIVYQTNYEVIIHFTKILGLCCGKHLAKTIIIKINFIIIGHFLKVNFSQVIWKGKL